MDRLSWGSGSGPHAIVHRTTFMVASVVHRGAQTVLLSGPIKLGPRDREGYWTLVQYDQIAYSRSGRRRRSSPPARVQRVLPLASNSRQRGSVLLPTPAWATKTCSAGG